MDNTTHNPRRDALKAELQAALDRNAELLTALGKVKTEADRLEDACNRLADRVSRLEANREVTA